MSLISRFQKIAAAACAIPLLLCAAARADDSGVQLHWLEGVPAVSNGSTWGVPWPEGKYAKDASFVLKSDRGENIPLQSWPLATWPDGSLKWSAFAIGANEGLTDNLTLLSGTAIGAISVESAERKPLTVTQDADTVTVDTNAIQCVLAKKGDTIIKSISRYGQLIAQDGQLVCLLRDKPDLESAGTWSQQEFTGEISSVTVEQQGPVRAVIKIEGKHANASRQWLPFIVRLYFYAGGDSIRIMHTIIYDGDMNKDFISGLGVRFSVPMRGELYDRHIRFAGQDDGVWGEAVRGITGLRRDPGEAVRQAQVAGLAAPPISAWNLQVSGSDHLDFIPAFGDFSLYQSSADSFVIRKRTKPGYTWLNSIYGKRAGGLGYVGSPQGGVAFGIRNFWQSFPNELEIRNATSDTAQVTMWLWSPQADPMDMRFYHDDMGENTYAKQSQALDITYEDYEPGFATPYGIARTSEMTLWALPATPSRDDTAKLANALRTPPQIVATPQEYHDAGIFGGAIWNLPDRSTPLKARVEDQLAYYFNFYKTEVEQRHWYGFWYFGNVMHTYDADRHVWRYDVGGFAWDNSELSTDLWLWFSFLRSGRADIFRFAEAMTRYTGEVDVYHMGRFAGLGTRHGVVPWGDSAKQLRISTAENRRFYYYLTADERVGDLLWEEVNADQRLADVEPDRKLPNQPSIAGKPYKETMGVGTDWGSVAAAQITAWERTGDTKYRDKLITSMKSIAALTHGWFSGGGGYDPETGKFYPVNDRWDVSHLSVVFGGFEVNAELLQLIDVPEYAHTWLQYCELYNASAADQIKALGRPLGSLNLGQGHSRLTAYAAWKENRPDLAARAWKEFLGGAAGLKLEPEPFPAHQVEGPAVLSPVTEIGVSTNAVNQWALAAIEVLSLAGSQAPPIMPP
jgi:hypothetical protein